MTKKRKIGILLILIGVGIPLVLFFFQHRGYLYFGNPTYKLIERKLTPDEIEILNKKALAANAWFRKLEKKESLEKNEYFLKYKLAFDESNRIQSDNVSKLAWTIEYKLTLVIPYKNSIGIGIFLIFIGVGIIIFSFLPKEKTEEIKNESKSERDE
jgi:hypothetical protein